MNNKNEITIIPIFINETVEPAIIEMGIKENNIKKYFSK
jgi:hypothetical protein